MPVITAASRACLRTIVPPLVRKCCGNEGLGAGVATGMTREGVMSQGAGPRLAVTKLRRWPRSGPSKATLRQSARWGGMTREQPTLVRPLLKAVEIESVGKGVPWWVALLSIENRLGHPDPEDL